jgi:hypothetical protein
LEPLVMLRHSSLLSKETHVGIAAPGRSFIKNGMPAIRFRNQG